VRYYVTFRADPGAPPAADDAIVVDIVQLPNGAWQATLDGRLLDVDVVTLGKQMSIRVNGQVIDLTTQSPPQSGTATMRSPPRVEMSSTDCRSSLGVESERLRSSAHQGTDRAPGQRHQTVVRSPMPGRVVRVLVAKGEPVRAGQGLVVLEAMKMENEVRANTPGIVADVHVVQGAAVERNALLVTLR
jgi:biotin carboxyl carrier protein